MGLMETDRGMSGEKLEIYLVSDSNRINDIMRALTVIAIVRVLFFRRRGSFLWDINKLNTESLGDSREYRRNRLTTSIEFR